MCLSWGVGTVEHGDIDYLYEIDAKTGDIYINGDKLTESWFKEICDEVRR
jgi:hypothetical protein